MSDNTAGYYRREDNGHVVEARYEQLDSGAWYCTLSVDAWQVKEAYPASKEAASEWCFSAWMELIAMGQGVTA